MMIAIVRNPLFWLLMILAVLEIALVTIKQLRRDKLLLENLKKEDNNKKEEDNEL